MANDINVTKNTTPGNERWDVTYIADQASTIAKTLNTKDTIVDRNIKVAITIPQGSVNFSSITDNSALVSASPINGLSLTASGVALPKTVSNGYIKSDNVQSYVNIKLSTSDVSIIPATTYTPTTSSQTIDSHSYLMGAQTIAGDSNLIAGNIKSGVTIFGVSGSYVGQVINNQQKSMVPSETAQTILPDDGYTGLSQVNVSAISSTYVGSDVPTKSAQTYIPTTSNQIINSGQYLTGNQTISGDANLISGNIKNGVVIFGITGSYQGSGTTNNHYTPRLLDAFLGYSPLYGVLEVTI